MKKISKRLASLLCAVLALTMLLPAAFAAEPVTVALSSVSGQPGQTVTVDVTISENPRRQRQHDCQLRSRKARIRLLQGRRVRRPCGGRLYQENGKAVPGKISIAFMVSGTLQEKATIGQITFKILNDSGSIPLKLEMRELVAYTPDGTETDLMDTVKTENASVSIKAPTTAPATTKPTTTAPDTTKPAATQPITEKPAESTTAETAVNPGTGEPIPCCMRCTGRSSRRRDPLRPQEKERVRGTPLHLCTRAHSLWRPAGGQAYPHLKAAWPQGRFALRSCRFRFSEACTCWNTVELIA